MIETRRRQKQMNRQRRANGDLMTLGQAFDSCDSAVEFVESYAAENSHRLRKRHCISVRNYNKRVTEVSALPLRLGYYAIQWECREREKGRGGSRCPLEIGITYDRKSGEYRVTKLQLRHNHGPLGRGRVDGSEEDAPTEEKIGKRRRRSSKRTGDTLLVSTIVTRGVKRKADQNGDSSPNDLRETSASASDGRGCSKKTRRRRRMGEEQNPEASVKQEIEVSLAVPDLSVPIPVFVPTETIAALPMGPQEAMFEIDSFSDIQTDDWFISIHEIMGSLNLFDEEHLSMESVGEITENSLMPSEGDLSMLLNQAAEIPEIVPEELAAAFPYPPMATEFEIGSSADTQTGVDFVNVEDIVLDEESSKLLDSIHASLESAGEPLLSEDMFLEGDLLLPMYDDLICTTYSDLEEHILTSYPLLDGPDRNEEVAPSVLRGNTDPLENGTEVRNLPRGKEGRRKDGINASGAPHKMTKPLDYAGVPDRRKRGRPKKTERPHGVGEKKMAGLELGSRTSSRIRERDRADRRLAIRERGGW